MIVAVVHSIVKQVLSPQMTLSWIFANPSNNNISPRTSFSLDGLQGDNSLTALCWPTSAINTIDPYIALLILQHSIVMGKVMDGLSLQIMLKHQKLCRATCLLLSPSLFQLLGQCPMAMNDGWLSRLQSRQQLPKQYCRSIFWQLA